MTTVGYGDLAPQSGLGRLLTTFMMLVGWGTLAVPTGIVTTEIALHHRSASGGLGGVLPGIGPAHRTCPSCGEPHHVESAQFCHKCGASMADMAGQETTISQ